MIFNISNKAFIYMYIYIVVLPKPIIGWCHKKYNVLQKK